MDDVRAVVDGVGSTSAVLLGSHDGSRGGARLADRGGSRRRLGDRVGDLGVHELKGIPGEWRLYAVLDA
jgi:hypothetical protein